jgi:hypothetical protein
MGVMHGCTSRKSGQVMSGISAICRYNDKHMYTGQLYNVLRGIDGQLYNGLCVCVCNKLSVTQLPDRSYSHYSMEAIKLHVWELWHLPMCVISFN